MAARKYREPDLGENFGKLEITGPSFLIGSRRHISTICTCGQVKQPRLDALLSGKQVSCGCHRDSQNKVANLTHGMGRVGVDRHPMYHTWSGMVQRTTNPKSTGYKWYGGKGVTVDPAWLDFTTFMTDMEPTWFKGGTLERLDNDLGYTKSNCKWITRAEQSLNKSCNYLLVYEGVPYTTNGLADKLGISAASLRGKLSRHRTTSVEVIVKSILGGENLKTTPYMSTDKAYKSRV
jgi:hypothetical protein